MVMWLCWMYSFRKGRIAFYKTLESPKMVYLKSRHRNSRYFFFTKHRIRKAKCYIFLIFFQGTMHCFFFLLHNYPLFSVSYHIPPEIYIRNMWQTLKKFKWYWYFCRKLNASSSPTILHFYCKKLLLFDQTPPQLYTFTSPWIWHYMTIYNFSQSSSGHHNKEVTAYEIL